MSRRLAVLAALVLSCAPLGAFAADPPKPVALTEADRKAFDAQFADSPVITLMSEVDPTKFNAFKQSLIDDYAAGKIDNAAMRKRVFDFASEARVTSMGWLAQAPDDQYMDFVAVQLSVMKTFARYNTRACYEMIENGGLTEDTINTLGPDLMTEINRLGAAQLVASRVGAKTPVTRQPPSDKEAQAAVQAFADSGGDMAWLRAMGAKTTGSMLSDERCAASIAWIETLMAQPKAAAVRLMSAK
uniref:DUF2059 domain-containing protein n=1 Tax=Caulobacter sp. (strain K31) TaxID=366602 RepID=B0SZ86_CAUSK